MNARRLAQGGQHAAQPHLAARGDHRADMNTRRGLGCRLDPTCLVYVPTSAERAEHELAHGRVHDVHLDERE